MASSTCLVAGRGPGCSTGLCRRPSGGHSWGRGIIDETGFLKKGVHSDGVARQAGRIENCQIGYVSARGTVLVDRVLYVSQAWTTDPTRLQAVGLAPNTPLAIKPELAGACWNGPWTRGCPWPGWWATVYGHSADLQQALEARVQVYVWRCPATKRSGGASVASLKYMDIVAKMR